MKKKTRAKRGDVRPPTPEQEHLKSTRVVDKRKNAELNDLRWYSAGQLDDGTIDEDEVFPRVWAIAQRMQPQQRMRRDMYLYFSCLYDDTELGALGPGSYESVLFEPSTLSFNVVRKMVDTAAARIAKNRPLPFPLTSGGDGEQQRRAKKFGRFIDGMFDTTKVWQTSPAIARDACLYGTGISHNYRVRNRIIHERVFPWEIFVDAREAIYGAPRNLYFRRLVDKRVLAERFPEFAEEIWTAQEEDESGAYTTSTSVYGSSDLAVVIEAWHLPSGVIGDDGNLESGDPNDGRHAIIVSNKTLFLEEYKRDYFPFSKLWFAAPLQGWFGNGIAKILTGLQYTINDTAQALQDQLALSGGYILVDDAAEVATDSIDNGPKNVLRHAPGHPPVWINPDPFNPQSWSALMQLLPQANSLTGISEFASESRLPVGMEKASGVAIDKLSLEDSDRLAIVSQNYEQYHIDTAWQQFDLAKEIEDEGGTYTVQPVSKVRGKRILEKLDFAKVKLDRDAFTLQVFPTSMLPRTPAERTAFVQSLANAGWLDRDMAIELLDFPDFEGWQNLSQSARNIVEAWIDRMLDAEDPEDPKAYRYPDPIMNMKLAIVMTQEAYLNGVTSDYPEKNLALLRQFILDCKAEDKKMATALAQQQAMQQAMSAPKPAVAPIQGAPPPPQMSTPTQAAPLAPAA